MERNPLPIWRARARTTLVFLTRLPIAPAAGEGTAGSGPSLAESAGLFPLAGLVVGILGGLAYWLATLLGLPPLLAALLAVGATILATGALHEDGLGDVADGFGGGFGRERKLAIMRDSALGSYGALALILSVGARVLALASLAGPTPEIAIAALAVAHAGARATLPAVMAWGVPARTDGLAARAGRPPAAQVWLALGLGGAVAVLVVGLLPGLAALAVAGLGAVLLYRVARAQIGGYTGDVLGAIEQLGEVLVLLTLVCLS